MGKVLYTEGQFFGKVLFKKDLGKSKGNRIGVFICPLCNSEYTAGLASIVVGTSKSCGCQMNNAKRTHGMAKAPEYKIWFKMKNRCFNKEAHNYKWYGAKGISICDRWMKFENFIADVGRRPSPKHSMDRFPDNKGNYEPGNVRWATSKEQQRNRVNSVKVKFNGVEKSLTDWCELLNIKYTAAFYRVVKLRQNTDEVFNNLSRS